MDLIAQSLAGLPAFLIYFGSSLVLVGAFIIVYTLVTPYREIELVREGNVAAAISLSGALLGFVLPLASAIAHSVGPIDMAVWGGIAFVVQLFAYFLVSRILPRLAEAIRTGRVAAATLHAGIAIAVGLLNAASMSY